MSLILSAVEGMNVVTNPSTVTAVMAVAAPTGTKCKATATMHRDGDTVTVTAITVPSASATIPDPGPYTVGFIATAAKCKAEGVLVLRQGDESETINATPQIPGSPDPVDYPVSFTVKITAAGQTKVKAQ
jgi:hypothetical protein